MEMAAMGKSRWRRCIMSRVVEVEKQEWRDVGIRETTEALHRNTTRDNNNPLI